MKNPIEKRLQTETFKRLAETFLGKKNFSWWAIFYAFLLIVVTGWLPDGITELIKGEWGSGAYKTVIPIVVLFFIGFQFHKVLEYEGKIEVISETPPPFKALALFLSVLSMDKTKQDKEVEALTRLLDGDDFTDSTLQGKTWEMPLIAIKHHLPNLKTLFVYTSPGEKGSSQLMPIFTRVVTRVFPSINIVEEVKPGGIDFENIEKVFNAVEDFYRTIGEKGFSSREVIVDITGGQKTNSIASAVATFSFGRKFQYVSTVDKKVRCYDIGYFQE